MDLWFILGCVSVAACSAFFTYQIISLVKFAINCKRESIKAVKYRINFGMILVVLLTVWFCWSTIDCFKKANEDRTLAELAESTIGSTEVVEKFVEEQEQKKGIIILDKEKYYLDFIESIKRSSTTYKVGGIGFLIWSIDGILTILGNFLVITGKGFRNSSIKDAIPIFAEYDKQNGKIIIQANDLTGKTETLFTVPANPKNLASLGQFIVWDEEQTIQEETL